jgi:transposase-like protein
VLTDVGAVALAVPRDPQPDLRAADRVQGRSQLEGFNKQIIALYTRGMTTGGIRASAAKHVNRSTPSAA